MCAFSDPCCEGVCAPDPTTGELTADADGGTCDLQTLTCGVVID